VTARATSQPKASTMMPSRSIRRIAISFSLREEQKQNNHPRASKIMNHAIDLASGHVFAGTPGEFER
jgi:hypothetical protein